MYRDDHWRDPEPIRMVELAPNQIVVTISLRNLVLWTLASIGLLSLFFMVVS